MVKIHIDSKLATSNKIGHICGIYKAMNHKNFELYNGEVTLRLLYDCRKIMAGFIVREGGVFLPIFSRIQNEIQFKEKQRADKEMALQIARGTYNRDINLSP